MNLLRKMTFLGLGLLLVPAHGLLAMEKKEEKKPLTWSDKVFSKTGLTLGTVLGLGTSWYFANDEQKNKVRTTTAEAVSHANDHKLAVAVGLGVFALGTLGYKWYTQPVTGTETKKQNISTVEDNDEAPKLPSHVVKFLALLPMIGYTVESLNDEEKKRELELLLKFANEAPHELVSMEEFINGLQEVGGLGILLEVLRDFSAALAATYIFDVVSTIFTEDRHFELLEVLLTKKDLSILVNTEKYNQQLRDGEREIILSYVDILADCKDRENTVAQIIPQKAEKK